MFSAGRSIRPILGIGSARHDFAGDRQLAVVMTAAKGIAPERRDIFLQRIVAMLRLRGRFTDDDVADVAKLALHGLHHETAA